MFKKIKSIISQSITEKEHILYCDVCHSKLIKRQGKFGEFLGCSQYPNCTFTKNINESSMSYEDFVLEQKISLKKYVSIISGEKECFRCGTYTTVSGLALIHNETIFNNERNKNMLDYGYDIYILPWSECMDKLPDYIQKHVLTNYSVDYKYSKTLNKKSFSNICTNCKILQGDHYVYIDTSHDSPFDPYNKKELSIVKLPLKKPLELSIDINSTITPTSDFLYRSKVTIVNI